MDNLVKFLEDTELLKQRKKSKLDGGLVLRQLEDGSWCVKHHEGLNVAVAGTIWEVLVRAYARRDQ